MLTRNILEVALLLIAAVIGLSIYLYAGKKIKNVESDLVIRKKKDIKGETIAEED